MSMQIVFNQILIIFIYVMVGFAAGKLRLVNPSERVFLTGFCTKLILPFTILSASSRDVSRKQMGELFLTMVVMFVVFILTTVVSLIFHKIKGSSPALRATSTALVTYPNCTFLGLPLCFALFGDPAILINAMAMVAFNVLFFSLQFTLYTGKKFNIKNLITVPMISTVILIIMLVFHIKFPAPVQEITNNIGAMITPVSLIVIGVMMSENSLVSILKEKRAYGIVAVRNLIVPAAAMLILMLMPMAGMEKLCVLVYLSCPCATLSTMYSIQNDMEPELAARSALLSTLFFALSLPLVIFAGQKVFG